MHLLGNHRTGNSTACVSESLLSHFANSTWVLNKCLYIIQSMPLLTSPSYLQNVTHADIAKRVLKQSSADQTDRVSKKCKKSDCKAPLCSKHPMWAPDTHVPSTHEQNWDVWTWAVQCCQNIICEHKEKKRKTVGAPISLQKQAAATAACMHTCSLRVRTVGSCWHWNQQPSLVSDF